MRKIVHMLQKDRKSHGFSPFCSTFDIKLKSFLGQMLKNISSILQTSQKLVITLAISCVMSSSTYYLDLLVKKCWYNERLASMICTVVDFISVNCKQEPKVDYKCTMVTINCIFLISVEQFKGWE